MIFRRQRNAAPQQLGFGLLKALKVRREFLIAALQLDFDAVLEQAVCDLGWRLGGTTLPSPEISRSFR